MLAVIAQAPRGKPEMISLECLQSRVMGKFPRSGVGMATYL